MILVVDDFGPARELYVNVLQTAGYRVEEAADGHEALEKGLKFQPRLLLMDLLLPGMDGWEVIRRLKDDERTSGLSVVVITGAPREAVASEAQLADCGAYLLKPVFPDALLRTVRDLLSRPTAS